MKRFLATVVLALALKGSEAHPSGLAAAGLAAAQQDPVTALQKRVEETSRKVNSAFVFFAGGSGVVISEDGWLLTNHHVIAGARLPKSVEIRLEDAKRRVAELVCTDPVGDIALLKLEPEEGKKFPFVPFADSDKLEIGQYVLAIGAPLGIGAIYDPAPDGRHYPSVSLGIVSALHRYQAQYGDCIQTDAAVNPGNSGGPLVDLDGRLVGINGRILTRFFNRVNSGVGFAIPSNQIANFLPKMKTGGIARKIYHGHVMGLSLRDRSPDGEGALVGAVRDLTTASGAGFKEGDVIVSVNGHRVFSPWRFRGLISTWPSETEVAVTVKRGGKTENLKVTLESGREQDITGQIQDPPEVRGGTSGATFNDEKDGTVTVTFVAPLSAAEAAGLVAGDVVQKVDGAVVKDRKTILERMRRKKPGDTIVLKVLREGEEREVEITLEKPKGD